MANLISCRPESYGRYRDRAYEALQQVGIGYVEIGAPPTDQVERVQKELGRYGLKVGSVTLGAKVQDATFLDEVQRVAEVASMLGTQVIFTSQHAGDTPRDQVFTALRQAGEACAFKNTFLCLETHPDLCMNAALARETMESIDHPNVRVNFDPANVYYYNEDVDAVEQLRQIAPLVRAVHLKDTNGGFKTWHFPAIGEGVVRWKELFSIMNAQSMTGPFTLEMEGIEGETLSFEQTCERVRKSVEYLKSIGAA